MAIRCKAMLLLEARTIESFPVDGADCRCPSRWDQ
jgi:hypothetical protein